MIFFKIAGISIAAIFAVLLLIAISLGSDYLSLQWDKFMAPQREELKKEIHESSREFKEGQRQQIAKYQYEFNTAKDLATRAAVCTVVRNMTAGTDISIFSGEQKFFIDKCLLGTF
jgi:hypothetical protein